VRNGGWIGSTDRFWEDALEFVFNPAVEAVRVSRAAPYPPSSVIRGITFAPESTIVRQAIDSDNWPITWADDGEQYTSYGDGWGFDPRTERKLSLARLSQNGRVFLMQRAFCLVATHFHD
jgi:hypothetical protein